MTVGDDLKKQFDRIEDSCFKRLSESCSAFATSPKNALSKDYVSDAVSAEAIIKMIRSINSSGPQNVERRIVDELSKVFHSLTKGPTDLTIVSDSDNKALLEQLTVLICLIMTNSLGSDITLSQLFKGLLEESCPLWSDMQGC